MLGTVPILGVKCLNVVKKKNPDFIPMSKCYMKVQLLSCSYITL